MEECTVCAGRVHEYERISTRYEGETYRFCSDEHKTVFEADPDAYR